MSIVKNLLLWTLYYKTPTLILILTKFSNEKLFKQLTYIHLKKTYIREFVKYDNQLLHESSTLKISMFMKNMICEYNSWLHTYN